MKHSSLLSGRWLQDVMWRIPQMFFNAQNKGENNSTMLLLLSSHFSLLLPITQIQMEFQLSLESGKPSLLESTLVVTGDTDTERYILELVGSPSVHM